MNRLISKWLFSFFLCLLVFAANADIHLPSVISDGMVLQRNSKVPIWGNADPNVVISVKGSWMQMAVSAQSDAKGSWKVEINTPEAGGPFTVVIKGNETVTLNNVWIGEVWVCSGQSNMEMPVQGWSGAPILHSKETIQSAHYPDIHFFTVKRKIAVRPQRDCKGAWAACSPQTIKTFSATAYYFGRALYEKLKVPIGLIHSSWGGTVAQAWTSREGLGKLGGFDKTLEKLQTIAPRLKEIKVQDKRNQQLWETQMKEVHTAYAAPDFEDRDWKKMMLPTNWEQAGYPDLDGIVWFRKTIEIPASWAGKELHLQLGPIDDEDITWFNGVKVGGIQKEGFWAKNRSYIVPGKLVKAGENVIAIRVTDLRGGGGIHGDKASMKLYPVKGREENSKSLSGNWKYKVAVVKKKSKLVNSPNTPTVLYNGMIAPIIPFGIRGAIWYQGEANVGSAVQYAQLFPTMISDWRSHWDEGNFPFFYVQIAPYPYGRNGMQSAALREAQRLSLRMPNTGMVVTLDIGDTTNIHPANKAEVGRRLSLWALAKVYGKNNITYSGPIYQGMKIKGNKVIVSFKHADKGLVTNGGQLSYFEIAGADGQFVPAKAVIKGKNVVVYSGQVAHPKAVRYAWKDTAVPHLFNKARLPASTFTSEVLK